MPLSKRRWLGLGIDVLAVSRMASFIKSHRGRLSRIFNPQEIIWAKSHKEYSEDVAFAAVFAMKEAAFKSLGLSPVMFMGWRDIVMDSTLTDHCHGVTLKNSLRKHLEKSKGAVTASWMLDEEHVVAVASRKDECAGS